MTVYSLPDIHRLIRERDEALAINADFAKQIAALIADKREARAKAIEEAAAIADGHAYDADDTPSYIRDAILALKDKTNEEKHQKLVC
jgi:hypothetical protein